MAAYLAYHGFRASANRDLERQLRALALLWLILHPAAWLQTLPSLESWENCSSADATDLTPLCQKECITHGSREKRKRKGEMVRILHPGDTVGVLRQNQSARTRGFHGEVRQRCGLEGKTPDPFASSLVSAPCSPTPHVLAGVKPATGTSVPPDIQNGGHEG